MPLIDDPNNLDAVTIAGLVQEHGYRGKASEEEVKNYIITGMAGLDVFIWVYNDKNIQFRCMVTNIPDMVTIDKINEFNKKWRYSKLYIEGDDLIMETDFFFDVNSEDYRNQFGRMLRIVDGATAILKNLVLNRS